MIDKLVVTKPFSSFVRGDIIANPAKIREIMDSDHVTSVRPVTSAVSGKD